ncbi:hypothetical protein FKR81_29115 [Lentzea tibetensis]|uniref:Uncharacterized protein n=1 Tax=Lentzea tibetensis TaxID=2591470 RepID=A0A563EME9_9PSEU|nr:hypothetical protein [Lentzea tibetensis]TWP48350.1 hypothetical protein FKR81_29115 [Lentzea tibetensis]
MRSLRPTLIMKATPMSKKKAWLMIGGGLLGVVVGTGLSMVVGGWFYLATIAAAVVFFLGVTGLAGHGLVLMVPAFVIGVIGPTLFAVLGHQAVLRQFGHEETCQVNQADAHLDVKRPYVDYVMSCPEAGRVEMRLPFSSRLPENEPARLLTRPPLNPLVASEVSYNGRLLLGIPVAMVALVLVAAAVRRK